MRCALCSNEENLLVNVVNDTGLILIFCQDCEDISALEAAARLAAENDKLREQVEKMKCCMNCKHSKEELEAKDAEIKKLQDIIALAYSGIKELKSQYIFCDCSDDPQEDMCMNCILQNIMQDIEHGKDSLADKEVELDYD